MKSLRSFLRNERAVIWLSALILLFTAGVSLCVGVVCYTPAQLLELPTIFRYVRLPRVAAAIFAGAGLAGAGVIIQTIFCNGLAGPNIIGVNAGAGFLTLVATLLFPLVPQVQPLAAFLGALLSVLLVYLLSRKAGASKMAVLLSGVVLNSLLNAAAEGLCTFFPDVQMGYSAFRIGGLASVQPAVLIPAAVLIVAFFVVVQSGADTLELLALGDETAYSLGVPVRKARVLYLICAAGMAGAAVSFAGLIGFLGLIVPHGARLLVGDEIKKLFPLSVLWGSLLMLVCDTVARTAFAPFELSVGIVLSVLGAPVFIRMLLRRKGKL